MLSILTGGDQSEVEGLRSFYPSLKTPTCVMDCLKIMPVALDPTSDTTEQLPGTVIRHSVLKRSSPTHFEVSVNFRSVDC